MTFFIRLIFVSIFCIFTTSNLFSQIDSSLIGEWYGIVEQANFGNYDTRMKISRLVKNELSGTTEYPELACGGDNIFLERNENIFIFSETITFGGNCVDGRIEIFKIDNDTIQWNWYFPNVTTASTFGKLIRQETTNLDYINDALYKSEIIPNPFSNQAQLIFKSAIRDDIVVSLYDLNGKLVSIIFKGEIQPLQTNTFLIDSNSIDSGMYLLHVKGNTLRYNTLEKLDHELS